MIKGDLGDLLVFWEIGGGAAARAHAALVAAMARHAGYRPRFDRVPPQPEAPADAWRPRAVCTVRAAGHEGVEGAAAPRLHVRLASPAPPCLAATELPFYAHADNLRNCTFLRMADIGPAWAQYERIGADGADGAECGECAVVVAGSGAGAAGEALQRSARAQGLLLRVLRGDALRLPASARGRSLLLLEEPLWAGERDVHVVYVPPCDPADPQRCRFALDYSKLPTKTECSAEVFIYAPIVHNLTNNFMPTAADIRDVLILESINGNNTEEAACEWFLKNLNRLDNLLPNMNFSYKIRVYLCRDDVDHAKYQQLLTEILNVINLHGLSIEIKNESISCLNENALHLEYTKHLHRIYEQQTIGWVASGPELSKIDESALSISLPIVSYEAPPRALRPNGMARAVAGSARVLARALAHLWAQCDVCRIAVISDRTVYSYNFMLLIREHDLNIRVANVTSGESIKVALQQFREADARVYFVNADENTAAEVMCAAEEAGMMDEREHLWVVREWRGGGGGGCGAGPLLSVTLAWRGEEGAGGWAPGAKGAKGAEGAEGEEGAEGAEALRHALDARFAGRAWPPLAAPLADAVLLLTHTLRNFLHHHPESKFDRRAFGNNKHFMEAVKRTRIRGVTQELLYNDTDFELESAMAFVERWQGGRRRVAAAWRLRRGDVIALWSQGALCHARLRDRPACLSTQSGDRFAPSCHDFIWISLILLMFAAPLMLYYARRARLHSLKLRDLALRQQLMEQLKISSRKFASHLVSRSEFELREELGSGAHGRVRVAVLRRPRRPPLAVAAKDAAEKCLQDEADLIREACVLSTLKHENIVRLLGVCLDGPAVFFMEYAFFGDLRNYLRVRRALAEFACSATSNSPLEGHDVAEAIHVSAPALTQLARHAAAALDYLSKQRIIHRDVRAANCLIDETRTLKLADFGLARTLSDEDEEYTNQHLRRLPIACMAPESLTNGVFSTASDVWGLGVLMLELVTLGAPPYGDFGPAEIMNRVRAGEHPPLPPAANALTCELLTQCWRLCAAERPHAAQLAAFLHRHGDALAPALTRPYSDIALCHISSHDI